MASARPAKTRGLGRPRFLISPQFIHVKLSAGQYERVRRYCADTGMTIAASVRRAIDEYLNGGIKL